jgi:Probable zinc-ribbon domain
MRRDARAPARTRSASRETTTRRLFFHPQRGAMLLDAPVPPPCRRYRGGKDADWRELAPVEVVTADGFEQPAPGQRPPPGFLWGDPTRQRFGLGGPELVFGPLEKVCRDCGAPFVFTAGEQKHLLEVLRLSTDATSVRCRRCRRAKLALERARAAYANALRAAERTPSATTHLDVALAVLAVLAAGGRAPLDKALAHCRRARRLGAAASADRVEQAIAARRAIR